MSAVPSSVPNWLFANNLSNPTRETSAAAMGKKTSASKPAAKAANGQPSAVLLDLIDDFLSNFSSAKAHTAFQAHRSKTRSVGSAADSHIPKPESLQALLDLWTATKSAIPATAKDDASGTAMDLDTKDSDEDSGSSSSGSSSSSSDDSSDASSDSNDGAKTTKTRQHAAKRHLKRKMSSSSSSDSSDSDSDSGSGSSTPLPKKPLNKKRKTASSKSTSAKSVSSAKSSSDDSSSEDSSSDDSSSDVSSSDDSSSDDSSSSSDDAAKASHVAIPESTDSSSASEDSSSSSDSESEAGDATLKPSTSSSVTLDSTDLPNPPLPPNPALAQGSNRNVKKQNEPFSRIPKNIKVDEKFASNAYVPNDYSQRAHEDLIITKGKGFTKEKNKKKRGSYRGGIIDIGANKGIYFDD